MFEGPRCHSEGFIPPRRIRQYFRRADLIIGKPGPGVVSEAVVCGLPYVTETSKPMAQELCVLDWLRETGVGVLLPTLEFLPDDLIARAAHARECVGHQQNRAVFEVADHLAKIIPGSEFALNIPSM